MENDEKWSIPLSGWLPVARVHRAEKQNTAVLLWPPEISHDIQVVSNASAKDGRLTRSWLVMGTWLWWKWALGCNGTWGWNRADIKLRLGSGHGFRSGYWHNECMKYPNWSCLSASRFRMKHLPIWWLCCLNGSITQRVFPLPSG